MLVLTPQRRQDPNTLCSEVPGSGLEISGGHDAYSRFDWRDCYGRVSSCDVAGVDPMVSRKELVDISGQGLCGGWKARNSRKRSRRSPEARTAGGPTLRGWHDLLDVRPNRGDLTSGVNFRRHRPSQQTAASIAELFGGAPPRGRSGPA